jgi:hypothetical protein
MNNYTVNAPFKLDTQSITCIQPAPMPVSATTVQPVSYQFQVVEYMKDDKIFKVELQARATTHDEFGNVMMSSGFKPVPRIQLPYIDHK